MNRVDDSVSEHISQNVESVLALYRRESQLMTSSQHRLADVGQVIGRPLFLIGVLVFVALWIALNSAAAILHFTPFDPPPFAWLDGILTFTALCTTTIVLIAQNRQAKLEQQRSHLDLQVNLLTEQKVTKLIHLLEELRRDLPMVANRDDPQAAAMQERTDAHELASAIRQGGLTGDSARLDE
jgi:uncharacterized membrane protein